MSAARDPRLPAFGPGLSDGAGDLDLALQWPVTDDDPPAVAVDAPAPPEATLDDVIARLDRLERAVQTLTELVELVVDTMPGSAEGSAS